MAHAIYSRSVLEHDNLVDPREKECLHSLKCKCVVDVRCRELLCVRGISVTRLHGSP